MKRLLLPISIAAAAMSFIDASAYGALRGSDRYSGSFCVPSRYDESRFTVKNWNQVVNEGIGNMYIRCPIKVPEGTNRVTVRIKAGYRYGRKSNYRDSITCSLFSLDEDRLEESDKDENSLESSELNLHLSVGSGFVPYGTSYGLSCRLPRYGTLYSYGVDWAL